MSLMDTVLREHEAEIVRWLKLSAGWSDQQKAAVMVGWLGSHKAKAMNDFLEAKDASAKNR